MDRITMIFQTFLLNPFSFVILLHPILIIHKDGVQIIFFHLIVFIKHNGCDRGSPEGRRLQALLGAFFVLLLQ
jgi:hypothetical protein